MSEFLYKYRDNIAWGICLLLSVIILNTNDNPQMQVLRLKASKIGAAISTPFQFIPTTIRLYRENRELNRALFVLNLENFRLKELEAENQRLRQMLNFVQENELRYIPAKVIGKNAGTSYNSITIDKGLDYGIQRGYPVMSSKGIVGQVSAVDSGSALCQVMLDNQFGAAVKVQRNRIDGILHWDGGNKCRLDGIPITMDVREGDTLITSGLGGVYPKGLAVGVVSKVRINPGNLFQSIKVEPFTDYQRLEEVFVLMKGETADGFDN